MKAESDAHLDAVLIGGREQRPIVLVAYDLGWPERYDLMARRVTDALGDAALSVDHIGSTAVPGLAAKPIIDMLLIVRDVADEAAYVPLLEAHGLVLRVREPGHRMLRTPGKDVHLHVLAPDAAEIADYRDLRDRLRADEADRSLYAATKQRLAERQWPDPNYYAEAKSDVIAEILGRARTA